MMVCTCGLLHISRIGQVLYACFVQLAESLAGKVLATRAMEIDGSR
jgi:hypothetical protein